MSRYRKVHVRVWGDEKFRSLSAPKPNGQTLWFFLMTGPHTGPIPGLFSAGEAALAESLGWTLKGFRRAWQEIESKGMAKADWTNRVIWLPNAIRYNPPESPNVVASWRAALDEIPDCELKNEASDYFFDRFEAQGSAYSIAWQHGSTPHASKIPREICEAVRARDRDTCRYCGRSVNWMDRRGDLGGTYDHIDPRGPNSLDNLAVACRACNRKKGMRTPSEAGMQLIKSQKIPGSDLGSDPGRTQVVPDNQEQEQEQDNINNPPVGPPRGTGAKRAPQPTPVPETFVLSDDLKEWASRVVPNLDVEGETEKFLDHHRAVGSRFKDWQAAWRKWMRNAADWGRARTSAQRGACDDEARAAAKIRRVEQMLQARKQKRQEATHEPGVVAAESG